MHESISVPTGKYSITRDIVNIFVFRYVAKLFDLFRPIHEPWVTSSNGTQHSYPQMDMDGTKI